MSKIKRKISTIIRKFEYEKFEEVINESIIILKNDNDFLWNLTGLSFQK